MVGKKGDSEKVDVAIIFVDIRGFTYWSRDEDVFQHSPELVIDFYNDLRDIFSDFEFKALGDGGFLVKEIPDRLKKTDIKKLINNFLIKIKKVNVQFEKSCKDFHTSRGHPTNLSLGWGLTRGAVNKLKGEDIEYIGSNINKAARLCNIARPNGIVIDKYDFDVIPKITGFNFHFQKRKLKSINEPIDVMVTDEIFDEFVTRENIKEYPEVHIAGLCFKNNSDEKEFLIAKRKKNRKLYPGLYEGCGGQLSYSETFGEGVVRHYQKEMKLQVKVLPDIYLTYSIKQPNEPVIPGICYLCNFKEGNPESPNHSEIKWIKKSKFEEMPEHLFIPGLKNEFLALIEKYENK